MSPSHDPRDDPRAIAEYLAIHYDGAQLAEATLDALHIGWPEKPRDRTVLIELIAAPRTRQTLAVTYLDIALETGALPRQFPDALAFT